MTDHPITEHPGELLLAVADGAPPPPELAAHLAACRRCRDTLGALAPLDLDHVWEGLAAELDAPRPGPLGWLLTRLGVDPSVIRFLAMTPSLTPAWLLANLAVLALIAMVHGMVAVGPPSAGPALVVAPLLAAGAVAFAYGPAVDGAYEMVAATPFSPVRALLIRLAAVLTVDAALIAGFGAVAGMGLRPGWVLPMAAVALLAATVAARSTPLAGALAGAGAWLLVLALRVASGRPLGVLLGADAQAVYAVVAVALLVMLVRRARLHGWSLPPGPA